MFCKNCGAKLNDDSRFCGKCGAKVSDNTTQSQPTNNSFFSKLNSTVKKAVNGAQQAVNDITGNQSTNSTSAASSHSMYEEFTPALGFGKKTIFTENSLIHGNSEYSYSELSQINVVTPSSQFTNGVAQAKANGKNLTIAFEDSQKERFAKAITYANEQIASAKGLVNNYKYILQSPNGTKLEVYEDYVILYYIKSGIKNILGNSMQGGSSGSIIYFSDLTLQLVNSYEGNTANLEIMIVNNGNISMPLNADDVSTANEIIAFIEEMKNNENNSFQEPVFENWEQVIGTEKRFPIKGKELIIAENMDVFNSYRLKFREMASVCADNARREYNKKVNNLVTYVEFFPRIYKSYLNALIKKSMDIFISEGVWTITEESFEEQHLANFHMAIDVYSAILEGIENTSHANQRMISGVMSFVPNLSGGGFGLKGAVKGIATATAFNIVRDGVESSLVNSVTNILPEQQTELFNRINADRLFERVFTDYWRVFLSLVFTLNKNGKSIWLNTNELAQQANNIFKNLSNPNFPQDKLLDVFIDILKTSPYNIEYHKFMISRFGENEETVAIKNYFGYTEFDNPRIV